MRLIDSDELKKVIAKETYNFEQIPIRVDKVQEIIDNAPTVPPEYFPPCEDCNKKMEEIRQAYDKMKAMETPQGEYVDISKLRLMKVEECAGHTIDYAMGWKACIEWIKKGGAE